MTRIGHSLKLIVAIGVLAAALAACSDELQRVEVPDGAPLPDEGPFKYEQEDVWTQSWGSAGDDVVTRAVRGPLGNLIISGYAVNRTKVFSRLLAPWGEPLPPPGEGALPPQIMYPSQLTLTSQRTLVYIAKVAPSGELLWVVPFFGGFDRGYQHGLATDNEGNIYFAGSFSGAATFGDRRLASGGTTDIVVAKLSPAGEMLWAKTAGGDNRTALSGGHNHAYQIKVQESGELTIAGVITGEVSFGAVSLRARGPSDGFVARLTKEGDAVWAVQAGSDESSGWEGAVGLAVDRDGNSYVTGNTVGPGEIGDMPLGGEVVSYVAKLDPRGNVEWVTAPPAEKQWDCSDLALDQEGNTYVSGVAARIRGNAPMVAKLDPAGKLLWETYAEGLLPRGNVGFQGGMPDPSGASGGVDNAASLVVTPGGEVIVAGHFSHTKMFGDQILTAVGGQDAFMALLDREEGQIREVRHLGGEAQEWGVTVVDDPDGSLWMVGHFDKTTEIGRRTLTSSGGFDIYAWRTLDVWFH